LSFRWTDARIGQAVRILASCSSVAEARKTMSREFGHVVTSDALRNAFSRFDLGTPTEFLGSDALEELTGETERLGLYDSKKEPQNERLLIIGDCHFPYVDRRAWNVMLEAAAQWAPHRIIQLGDYIDAYPLSTHAKDPTRAALIDEEIVAANAGLDELDSLGAKHKHFVEGNHEFRLQRLLQDKAPALYNQVTIPQFLGLGSRGWTYTPYRQHLTIGRIHYVHDTGSAGATAHTKAGQAFESSAVIGHVHRLACTYFGNALGETHVAVAAGWLGSVEHADYMHQIKATREWMHGFVTGVMEPNGTTHLQLHPIVNGKVRLGAEVVAR
jgi:predicted phosphodiesterase